MQNSISFKLLPGSSEFQTNFGIQISSVGSQGSLDQKAIVVK